MPKTEITNPGETSVGRPRDIFSAMRDEMDRMFGRFERDWAFPSLFGREGRTADLLPELDVREGTDSITIEIELPGVEEKDISVTLANGVLTIKGEKKLEKQEKSENYHVTERSFGSFQRSLRLPDMVDDSKVEAKFDKGVLKVTAAKKPEAVKGERAPLDFLDAARAWMLTAWTQECRTESRGPKFMNFAAHGDTLF